MQPSIEFAEIYEKYSPKIYRLCMGYINDHDKAKDLMQETFIAVWQNRDKFQGRSSIGTWIYRIATNTCFRQIEKDKKFPWTVLPFEIVDKVEASVENKVLFLYRAISELEEADRIIISLVLEGLPQAEIAEITGMSEGNTRVKIHRIKQKLTQKFTKYEHI